MKTLNSLYGSFRLLKRIKLFLKKKAGWLGVPKMIVYRGFGNEKEGWITGRVIEDSGLAKPKDAQKAWQNFIATIKRYASDAIIGVGVEARLGNQVKETHTDEYGFFSFHFRWEKDEHFEMADSWRNVHFRLLDTIMENQPQNDAVGEIQVIVPDRKRIIVSDIDDTVMVSHSTRIVNKLRLMFFKNAYSRLTFEGAPEFYQALEKGKSGKESHPVFFVSSSEWNLYDLLEDFFNYNRIPKGILLLQKFNRARLRFWKSEIGKHQHKQEKIRKLLEVYSTHSFILIGDSGQSDSSIYQQLAKDYPERIEAIYIRKVHPKKYGQTLKTIQIPGPAKSLIVEFPDSYSAMEHARDCGYIHKKRQR